MFAMLDLKAYVALALILLSGCAPVAYQIPDGETTQAEVELVPPVPTFISLSDCERAYGLSSCGTGQVIYTQANLAPPPESASWYMPFAFGVMTGVLVNQFYSPPTVYIQDYRYRRYLSPTYISYYRRINTVQVTHYRNAPIAVQRSTFTSSGPVRYVPPARFGNAPTQAPRYGSTPAPRPVSGTAPEDRRVPRTAAEPRPATGAVPVRQPTSATTPTDAQRASGAAPAPQRGSGAAPPPQRSSGDMPGSRRNSKEKNEK